MQVCSPEFVQCLGKHVNSALDPAPDSHWHSVAKALQLDQQQVEEIALVHDVFMRKLTKLTQVCWQMSLSAGT